MHKYIRAVWYFSEFSEFYLIAVKDLEPELGPLQESLHTIFSPSNHP